MNPTNTYVDVEDTLIRSFGTKSMPMQSVVDVVKSLHQRGHQLYGWSSAGAEYAESSASEVGLHGLFTAFLPKPHIMLDDAPPEQWPGFRLVLPGEATLLG